MKGIHKLDPDDLNRKEIYCVIGGFKFTMDRLVFDCYRTMTFRNLSK